MDKLGLDGFLVLDAAVLHEEIALGTFNASCLQHSIFKGQAAHAQSDLIQCFFEELSIHHGVRSEHGGLAVDGQIISLFGVPVAIRTPFLGITAMAVIGWLALV